MDILTRNYKIITFGNNFVQIKQNLGAVTNEMLCFTPFTKLYIVFWLLKYVNFNLKNLFCVASDTILKGVYTAEVHI